MAAAVQKIYPGAQVTIGPWIDNGFYYDFFMSDGSVLKEEDFKSIKKEMDRLISADLPITREEVTRSEARRRIEALDEPFKLEILDSIKTEPITIYHLGDQWWDLCAGPHVESTGKLPKKAIQLQSVAGAYWRGDEKREVRRWRRREGREGLEKRRPFTQLLQRDNQHTFSARCFAPPPHRQMLSRVYATAWKDPGQLKQYKKMVEEAKKRDHRLLGKKLDLFSIQEDAGGGLVFWHPKGAKIRTTVEDFWRKSHVENGYELVYSPHIANVELWKTSGHFDFYQEGMFDQMEVEGADYQIKVRGRERMDTVKRRSDIWSEVTASAVTNPRMSPSTLPLASLAAHELPLPLSNVQRQANILPRSPHPLGRARYSVQVRAFRHPPRPNEGPRLHSGRRAHILPP